MKKKEEEIYCVFCGTKNNKADKKCKKCDKKLNPKNRLFKDYLKDHLKDDIKSNIEDTIVELIIEWIKKHLYGIAMTALIGLLAATVIVKEGNIRKLESQKAKVNHMSNSFTLKVFCEEKDLVDKIRVCDAGYSLEGDSCVKRTSVAAKANTSCPNGYSIISGQCISNNTVAKIEKFTCDSIPSIMPDDRGGRHSTFGTVIQGNECYARLCIVTTAGVSPLPSDESLCDSIALMKSTKTSTYSCAEYTDGEGNCRSIANKTTYYTCSSGTLSGSSCVTTETKAFNEVCPEGSTYDAECGKCERGALQ